jgi:hypothetical protein
MKKLIFASGNVGSLRAIQAILGRLDCGTQTPRKMPRVSTRLCKRFDIPEATPVNGTFARCALLADE